MRKAHREKRSNGPLACDRKIQRFGEPAIKVQWLGAGTPPPAGTKLLSYGVFETFEPERNPGLPNRMELMRAEGIVGTFRASEMREQRWTSPISNIKADFKASFHQSIIAGLDPESTAAKVILAVVIGEKSPDSLGLIRAFLKAEHSMFFGEWPTCDHGWWNVLGIAQHPKMSAPLGDSCHYYIHVRLCMANRKRASRFACGVDERRVSRGIHASPPTRSSQHTRQRAVVCNAVESGNHSLSRRAVVLRSRRSDRLRHSARAALLRVDRRKRRANSGKRIVMAATEVAEIQRESRKQLRRLTCCIHWL